MCLAVPSHATTVLNRFTTTGSNLPDCGNLTDAALELSLDIFLRHPVDGVEGGCRIPGRVREFVAELTVSSFDVHEEPRRGTPLAIGAKLDSLGGVQGSEASVEAFLRLVTGRTGGTPSSPSPLRFRIAGHGRGRLLVAPVASEDRGTKVSCGLEFCGHVRPSASVCVSRVLRWIEPGNKIPLSPIYFS